MCPWIVAGPEYAGESKDDLLERLQSDEQAYNAFMGHVAAHEKTKNGENGKPGPRRAGGNGGHAAQRPPLASLDASVSARSTTMHEFRQVVGHIWPPTVFEQYKGKKPSKKNIKTYMVGATKVRGVLLAESEGTAPGVIQLFSIAQQAADFTANIANTRDNTAEEVQEVAAHAAKRLKISSSLAKPK